MIRGEGQHGLAPDRPQVPCRQALQGLLRQLAGCVPAEGIDQDDLARGEGGVGPLPKLTADRFGGAPGSNDEGGQAGDLADALVFGRQPDRAVLDAVDLLEQGAEAGQGGPLARDVHDILGAPVQADHVAVQKLDHVGKGNAAVERRPLDVLSPAPVVPAPVAPAPVAGAEVRAQPPVPGLRRAPAGDRSGFGEAVDLPDRRADPLLGGRGQLGGERRRGRDDLLDHGQGNGALDQGPEVNRRGRQDPRRRDLLEAAGDVGRVDRPLDVRTGAALQDVHDAQLEAVHVLAGYGRHHRRLLEAVEVDHGRNGLAPGDQHAPGLLVDRRLAGGTRGEDLDGRMVGRDGGRGGVLGRKGVIVPDRDAGGAGKGQGLVDLVDQAIELRGFAGQQAIAAFAPVGRKDRRVAAHPERQQRDREAVPLPAVVGRQRPCRQALREVRGAGEHPAGGDRALPAPEDGGLWVVRVQQGPDRVSAPDVEAGHAARKNAARTPDRA